jgi:small subunit ribosomal protein S9
MPVSKALNTVGRRKQASARLYITPVEGAADSTFVVNGRTMEEYFPHPTLKMVINQPLVATDRLGKYNFVITVIGGGSSGQAGAVRHAVARALEKAEPELRPVLKKGGFLTRDSRAVERKKPGRHKARKKPQFSKR